MKKNVTLPAVSFVTSVLTNETMMIKCGKRGYFPVEDKYKPFTAEQLNRLFNITPEQDLAMQVGALYGWKERGADPMYHVKNQSVRKINGTYRPKRNKQKKQSA